MAKKKKLVKKAKAIAKADIAPEQKASPWMNEGAPWEEYCGLDIPVMNSDNKIVSIIHQKDGSLRIEEPKYKTAEDAGSFDFGGGRGTKTIYGTGTSEDEVLLDEDLKIRAMEMSYKFNREDPIYHAAIQGYLNFIIGKGVKLKASDEDPRVQEYLDKFWNENQMDGRDSTMVKRWLLTGENALRWFVKDAMGHTAKIPKVRLIPFWKIVGITKDAEDAEKIVSYQISVAKTEKDGTAVADQMETVPVPADQIQFWHNGEPEESRGEPPFVCIMRAVKWYADWMLNRVVLNRYRTAHVLFKKLKSVTPAGVISMRNQMPDATAHKGLGGKIEKRLPKPGTMVIHGDNIEYEWKSPNLGANDANVDGKTILRYIGAGGQLPEFMLGDLSQANFSSTIVAQNPFVRQVEFFQDVFDRIFGSMGKRAIEHGIKTGAIPKISTETVVRESGTIMRRVRRLLKSVGLVEATEGGDKVAKKKVKTKTTVTVIWPNLIYQDKYKEAQTLQIHKNMGAASVETIREKLTYDHDQEERRMENGPEGKQDDFDRQRQAEIDQDMDDIDDDEDKPND